MTTTREDAVPVGDGRVPVWTAGPDDAGSRPGLVVVPSIFGANEDLLAQMRSLSDLALTVVMDPFWRQGGGALAYDDPARAFDRLSDFDRGACRDDVEAVARWTAARTNGEVIGLGICFGGPWVLLGAAKGLFCAAATWHGSGLESVLDRVGDLAAPLRLHFGEVDAITPPATVDAVRARFADHPDCRIVVHPGADHGFSHEGASWDPTAAAAGLADVRSLLIAGAT